MGGGGYHVIVARSGREYLLAYPGPGLNSSVYAPDSWNRSRHAATPSVAYWPQSGTSLGSGHPVWVLFKAHLAVWRHERRENKKRRARAAASLIFKGYGRSTR